MHPKTHEFQFILQILLLLQNPSSAAKRLWFWVLLTLLLLIGIVYCIQHYLVLSSNLHHSAMEDTQEPSMLEGKKELSLDSPEDLEDRDEDDPLDYSAIEEQIDYPKSDKLDSTPAMEVPDTCVTAVEDPAPSTSHDDAYEVHLEDLHQPSVETHGNGVTTNTEKKKKVKKKKKKITRKVDKLSDHSAMGSLPKINSGPVHEAQMVARATSESRIIRPASRSSSPQKLLDGEINIGTYHPYHTVLLANAYIRPVVVTLLIPEKLPGNPTDMKRKAGKTVNSSSSSVNKTKIAKPSTSSAATEISDDSGNEQYGYDDSTGEEDNSKVERRRNQNSTKTEDSLASSSMVDRNLLFALDIKHFRYMIIKVNDVVSSREAIYPIVLRDFRALLKDLTYEYSTPAVGDYYRPNSLKWWARYLKKIVLVYDKPTGQLSALVDKKAIRRIIKKKMEHHQWMNSSISSSQQHHHSISQISPQNVEGKLQFQPCDIQQDVDPFSSTYKSQHGMDEIKEHENTGELDGNGDFVNGSLSSVNNTDEHKETLDSNGSDSRHDYFAFSAEVDSSFGYSEDELGGDIDVADGTFSVVLPAVAPDSSSSQQHPKHSGQTKHQRKPKSSSSANHLPNIQRSHSSPNHGPGRSSAAVVERVPSAAELRTNKLLSKAYAPLIPPYTQDEIEEMFAPKKKKRPTRQPKPIAPEGSVSISANTENEDHSLQLSDASVGESLQEGPSYSEECQQYPPNNSAVSIQKEGSISSFRQPYHRPRSPFQENLKGLKKPSEKLVADILVKARKAVSASEEFQNRKISLTEVKLLDRLESFTPLTLFFDQLITPSFTVHLQKSCIESHRT